MHVIIGYRIISKIYIATSLDTNITIIIIIMIYALTYIYIYYVYYIYHVSEIYICGINLSKGKISLISLPSWQAYITDIDL